MKETITKTTETKVILNKNYYITILKDTFLLSTVKNLFTVVCLLFSFWFNYHFIGNSYFVNFLILVGFFCGMFILVDTTNKDKYFYNVSKGQFEEIKQILKK